MKNNDSPVSLLYRKLTADERVSVWHISLYTAILYLWERSCYQEKFRISRAQLMKLAHIKSMVTYHKCLGDLQRYAYINYYPTYDSLKGSRVSILRSYS